MGYSLRRIKKDTQKNRAAGKITCIDWESCWKTKTFTCIKCSYTIMKKNTTVHEISTHKTELYWTVRLSPLTFSFFFFGQNPSIHDPPSTHFPKCEPKPRQLAWCYSKYICFLHIGVHSSTREPSFCQLTQKVQQLVIGSLSLSYPEVKRKYC